MIAAIVLPKSKSVELQGRIHLDLAMQGMIYLIKLLRNQT